MPPHSLSDFVYAMRTVSQKRSVLSKRRLARLKYERFAARGRNNIKGTYSEIQQQFQLKNTLYTCIYRSDCEIFQAKGTTIIIRNPLAYFYLFWMMKSNRIGNYQASKNFLLFQNSF